MDREVWMWDEKSLFWSIFYNYLLNFYLNGRYRKGNRGVWFELIENLFKEFM